MSILIINNGTHKISQVIKYKFMLVSILNYMMNKLLIASSIITNIVVFMNN